mmetsp:Transcript_22233/g.89807  ORF Transcript_22233/g.89807 Transcript_22233/m.89807 type:complete len:271 (-) Transcript_22233:288-1100(-)
MYFSATFFSSPLLAAYAVPPDLRKMISFLKSRGLPLMGSIFSFSTKRAMHSEHMTVPEVRMTPDLTEFVNVREQTGHMYLPNFFSSSVVLLALFETGVNFTATSSFTRKGFFEIGFFVLGSGFLILCDPASGVFVGNQKLNWSLFVTSNPCEVTPVVRGPSSPCFILDRDPVSRRENSSTSCSRCFSRLSSLSAWARASCSSHSLVRAFIFFFCFNKFWYMYSLSNRYPSGLTMGSLQGCKERQQQSNSLTESAPTRWLLDPKPASFFSW